MLGPMLQSLIKDRFQVEVHRESRDQPVYELTVAKSNSNLRPTKEGSCIERDAEDFRSPATIKPSDLSKYCGTGTAAKPIGLVGSTDGLVSSMDWHGLSMAGLVSIIVPYVDRPVIDKTGLTGLFDFHLEYVPNHSWPRILNGSIVVDSPGPSDSSIGPSIIAAFREQLGLKLSPAHANVEFIVIDQVEKPSPD